MLFLFSNSALANIATPLWKTDSFVLTELIRGLVEGLVVSFALKASIKRGILIMLLANYASALIGLWTFDFGIIKPESTLIYGDYSQNVGTLKNTLYAYLVTCLIEFPFIMWVCKSWKKKVVQMILVCLLVQLLTYPIFLIHLQWIINPQRLINMGVHYIK